MCLWSTELDHRLEGRECFPLDPNVYCGQAVPIPHFLGSCKCQNRLEKGLIASDAQISIYSPSPAKEKSAPEKRWWLTFSVPAWGFNTSMCAFCDPYLFLWPFVLYHLGSNTKAYIHCIFEQYVHSAGEEGVGKKPGKGGVRPHEKLLIWQVSCCFTLLYVQESRFVISLITVITGAMSPPV